MDRSDGNKVVNNSVITIYSTDTSIIDLTKPFVMVNNTDSTLVLYLRKTVHTMADSTTDYFCFGPKCWPDTDTTDLPGILPPGVEDYSFASHIVHVRRFEMPPLPPGITSITYTIFDNTTFSEPVEAKVTVNYHLSPVNIPEYKENSVSVYPNPASDWLTIRTDNSISSNFKLIILNVNGEIVMDRQTNIKNGYANISVDGLVPGIYFGRMLHENNQTACFKFLVGN